VVEDSVVAVAGVVVVGSVVAADLAGLVEAVPAEEARAAIGKSHS
jgi:hypothetical protein